MAVIGSNNEQGAYPTMVFQVSQTWACPVAMEAIVYVIGAGGSGCAIGGDQDQAYNARGGAAGGCAVSRLSLAAQDYTVTIGSGGDDKNASSVSEGEAGGNSVFSGTGISTMTGNGGAGGTGTNSAQNVTTGGGTATGGNLMNNTGGGGGANTSANSVVSGGGGVNLYGSAAHGDGEAGTYAAGGSPIGIAGEVNSTSSGNHADSYYYPQTVERKDTPLSINYFSSLMVHQAGFNSVYDVDLSSNKRTNFPSTVYSNTRQYVAVSSNSQQKGLYTQAGPFCGGAGYRASCSGASTSAQTGGVGAGGGACMNTSGSRTANSGCGGSGLIIIFPIQLG